MSDDLLRDRVGVLPLPDEDGNFTDDALRSLVGVLPLGSGDTPQPPEEITTTVVWRSTTLLSCADCLPANVILCVGNGKAASGECSPDAVGQETVQRTTVPATITIFKRYRNSCGKAYYLYTFEYALADVQPDTFLDCDDIQGVVCDGCLTNYVRDVAGNEVTIEEIEYSSPPTLQITTQHGCKYNIIKPDAIIVEGDSGPAQVIYPGDTLNILGGAGVTTTASDLGNVTVDIDLSEDESQIAQIVDGQLLVPSPSVLACPEILDCINTDGLITGAGTEGSPYTVTCTGVRSCINTTGLITGSGTAGSPYSVSCTGVLGCINTTTPISGNGTAGNPYSVNIGPGLEFSLGAIRVNTSGAWGAGTLNFPACASTTSGEAIYVDSGGNIRTAPPHTTITAGSSATSGTITDISTAGTVYTHATTPNVNVSNSTCREIRCIVVFHLSAFVTMQTSGVWEYSAEYSINGGASYTPITITSWGPMPGATSMTWAMPASLGLTIPAGTTYGIRFRGVIKTIVSSGAGSVSGAVSVGWSLIGSTV